VSIQVDATGLAIKTIEVNSDYKIVVNRSDKTKLRVKNYSVIPDGSMGHVPVDTDFRNTVLHVDSKIAGYGKIIPNCIIKTDENNTTLVPVLNVSGKEKQWTQGETLTRGEVCTEKEFNSNANNFRDNTLINPDEVVTDDDDKGELMELLNKYQDVICQDIHKMGVTKEAEMRIKLKDEEKTVYYRPYRMSYQERNQLMEMVNQLKEADIIEDSMSEFASPVILVKKKSGELRLCIDYRELNKNTIKDHYPIPRIDDQLDRLGKLQIRTITESKNKTAFITPDDHYQFKRMPFGLCNAQAVFQRLINRILGNLRFTTAIAYLDDLLIASKTRKEGLENLEVILELIRT